MPSDTPSRARRCDGPATGSTRVLLTRSRSSIARIAQTATKSGAASYQTGRRRPLYPGTSAPAAPTVLRCQESAHESNGRAAQCRRNRAVHRQHLLHSPRASTTQGSSGRRSLQPLVRRSSSAANRIPDSGTSCSQRLMRSSTVTSWPLPVASRLSGGFRSPRNRVRSPRSSGRRSRTSTSCQAMAIWPPTDPFFFGRATPRSTRCLFGEERSPFSILDSPDPARNRAASHRSQPDLRSRPRCALRTGGRIRGHSTLSACRLHDAPPASSLAPRRRVPSSSQTATVPLCGMLTTAADRSSRLQAQRSSPRWRTTGCALALTWTQMAGTWQVHL